MCHSQLRHVRRATIALQTLLVAVGAQAATFTVSTTIDSVVAPSLRRAILDANANPGPDRIVFDLPPGPQVLVPTAPLPDITGGVEIDGFNGAPCLPTSLPPVEIDGVMAGPFADGLRVNTTQPVTIRGLAIYRFTGGSGIAINNSDGGRIEGNHLGTDASGSKSGIGNRTGLQLNGAKNYIVGGNTPCEQNVISGNIQEGIWINGPLFVPQNNQVTGNFIGTTRSGWSLPNGSHGIHFLGGPTGNRVEANVIANNAGSGVLVLEGLDNQITANSIYANGVLGIDISPSGGPNPNDFLDIDLGPNREQNYPFLGGAGGSGGVYSDASGTHVSGFMNSEPATTFAIHFYWSPSCDPSGFGEGRHYLGARNVTTDAAGNVTFSADFPESVPAGSVLTATATHPMGSTSEFSPCASLSPSGSNIVQHEGLPHHGGEGSVPVPCPEGFSVNNPCTLLVPSATNGNNASVRVGLGRVSGWQGDLQDVLLSGFGDKLELGFLDETETPQPPEEIFVAAKEYRIEYTPPQPSLVLAALTNGSMWLQFTLIDSDGSEVYTGRPESSQFHLLLNSSNAVVDISQAGYMQLPNGERALRLEFRNPLLVTLPAVQHPIATRAIIAVLRRESPTTGQLISPPRYITTARVSYHRESPTAGAPLAFRLGEELLQQFGQWHGSLRNSVLAGWHWSQSGTGEPAQVSFPAATIHARLPVDAAGAPTEGGVMLRLDSARYICIDLDWDAGSALPFAGAASPFQMLPYFRLMIGTNHVLPPSPDTVLIRKAERDWEIAPGFGTSGARSNRYEFFRDGVLVGSSETVTGTVAQATSAPLRMAHSTSVSPAGSTGFLFKWREAASFFIPGVPAIPGLPGAGGVIVADELRIIPLNPTNPLRSFTRVDVAAGGLPWIEITGEDWRSSRVGRVAVQKVRDGIELSIPTEAGRPYQLEFTPSLNAREWQIIDSFLGDGSVRTWPIREAANRPPHGFYRVGGF